LLKIIKEFILFEKYCNIIKILVRFNYLTIFNIATLLD